ncbi:aldehyde dehydrogenase family protein [Thalassotalea sp. HSM 43]|uniref:aldehyde dehydrogenase family protein n=1 Tax=Thalassotalea sp. HSM 43 TaxID=2552945 RepID=UPI001080400D|nr:aldehyde dehydrogenase family protein [Thalassotalea sp. HSM 43]QBY03980.1 aldehyde dehydrogenase family protein [Thalassotalea sp. HSM 43]
MHSYQQFYINGQWQTPANQDQSIAVINPANGEQIAITASADLADVDSAIGAAKKAFPEWSRASSQQRKQFIVAIADEMQNRLEDLSQAISQSMGCPIHHAREVQVQASIDAFREFADMTDYVDEAEHLENVTHFKVPIGVCVLINPWNYPLSQLVGKLGPAMATGCTVVVKPSEQTPLQDFIMAEIFAKVGVPAGVFNVISGYGHKIGEHLCAHVDVDMVSFTGSTAAGVKVAQASAPTIKRVCQELGGKSAMIITEDADLETAVTFGVGDVMFNSGQTCSALTRMLVPQSRYDEAVALAKNVAEQNIVGDPLNEKTTMGPLSSLAQKQRVLDYIHTGIKEGARIVTGGTETSPLLQNGAYVMPTIFADVGNEMTIAQQEIFGPVLCIIAYENEQQAIEMANDSVYGLASAVFAKDNQSAIHIARQIRAGQCYIQGGYFNTQGAFGGFKQSGNGREWGREGLREYVELQAVFSG